MISQLWISTCARKFSDLRQKERISGDPASDLLMAKDIAKKNTDRSHRDDWNELDDYVVLANFHEYVRNIYREDTYRPQGVRVILDTNPRDYDMNLRIFCPENDYVSRSDYDVQITRLSGSDFVEF